MTLSDRAYYLRMRNVILQTAAIIARFEGVGGWVWVWSIMWLNVEGQHSGNLLTGSNAPRGVMMGATGFLCVKSGPLSTHAGEILHVYPQDCLEFMGFALF